MSLVISSVTSRGGPIRCASRVSLLSGGNSAKTPPVVAHGLQQMPKICNYNSSSRSDSSLLMIQNSIFAFLGSAASLGGTIFVYTELVEDKTSKCSHLIEERYPWQEFLKLDSFNDRGVDTPFETGSPVKDDSLQYEPTSSISDGMMEVVEAGVNKASAWEKKAKAVVEKLIKPSRYDVS